MKHIKSFLLGVILASASFIAFSVKADNEPKIVGDNGLLIGIEIVSDKGEALCISPDYNKTEKTLSCD